MIILLIALLQTMSSEAESLAREALARALGDRADEAETRSVTPTEWPSTALGCPSPDETYASRLVPGHRVLLVLEGALYRVHVGDGRAVLCGGPLTVENDLSLAPGDGIAASVAPAIDEPEEAGLKHLVEGARADLAERLAVDVSDIELLEAKPVQWPNGALGCPHPEMSYRQVPVDGVRIRLRVGKRVYPYHGGGGREPFLCERSMTGR